MLDVRMDLLHMLDSDAMTFGSCRKVINVALYMGEFGSADKRDQTIAPRNYPQAAAALRRIGLFINDLPDLVTKDSEEGANARAIRNLKVGGLVITVFEKVADPKDKTKDALIPVIIYNAPIRNGEMTSYERKYQTIMATDTP